MYLTECTECSHSCTYDFVVCKNISRPFILGIDFLRKNLIDICWTSKGKFGLKTKEIVLIESLETSIAQFSMHTRNQVEILGRHIAVLDVKVNPTKEHLGKM